MFTPPRFVVVDDKPEHLDAILDVFQTLGAPCQGVAYDAERGLDNRHLAGVRVLFVDLHLTDLAATTDETRHFAIIAGILEDGTRATGGPFVLVVWTEHEHLVTQLTTYLDEGLDPVRPRTAVLVSSADVERIHRYFQEVRQLPMRTSQFVCPEHKPPICRDQPGAPVDMLVPGVQVGRNRIKAALCKRAIVTRVGKSFRFNPPGEEV